MMTRKQLKWIIKEIFEQINRIDESFDLRPINPKAKFSVNGWQWRPILELITKANAAFDLNIKDLDKWNYNNGNGLKTKKECNQLANALERLVGKAGVQPYNRPIRAFNLPKKVPGFMPKISGEEPYQTDVGTIQKFIKFLRECDGFEIW
jgi:hypothetical protein